MDVDILWWGNLSGAGHEPAWVGYYGGMAAEALPGAITQAARNCTWGGSSAKSNGKPRLKGITVSETWMAGTLWSPPTVSSLRQHGLRGACWGETRDTPTPDPRQMTLDEAKAFIRSFPHRFARQGYYLTATRERIPVEAVELEVEEEQA